jgi:hypothetical protein
MELTEAIPAFEKFDGKYKRDQVAYALEHQEEITPHLIKILKNILDNPLEYITKKDYYAHIYALILLGYFKETKVHQLIIDLFSIPDDFVNELFGDIATDNLPIVLFQTCAGSLENIKTLILNKNAPDTSRISAIGSMLYAVADELISREEVLAFLGTLFTGEETDPSSDFWGFVASDICDLCPDKHIFEIIKKAYDDGLINSGIVGYEEFEESMELGVDSCLAHNRQNMQKAIPEDIHDAMSWWACFEENEQKIDQLYSTPVLSTSSINRKKKPKKKAKNKNLRPKKKKKKRKKRK